MLRRKLGAMSRKIGSEYRIVDPDFSVELEVRGEFRCERELPIYLCTAESVLHGFFGGWWTWVEP